MYITFPKVSYGICFWNFWRIEKKIDGRVEGIQKKSFLQKKWCFFVFEFVLYFCLALFWGILLSFMRDVQILSYFCLKCLFLPLYFWQSSWQKLWYIKICYWCLWTAGDQKIRYRSFLSSKTSSFASELAKTDQGPQWPCPGS